jgi:GDP-4-dehydro-6-deoxy-D-mannose reductase
VSDTILVTGAAGFVGSHLLRLLDGRHTSSTLIAWRRPQTQGGSAGTEAGPTPGDGRVRWVEVDLLDARAVSQAITESKPTQVYHCAGVASVGDSWSNNYTTLRTNVLGTEHLLTALRDHAPEARTLIPGSALIYKPSDTAIDETGALGPVSPYGLSKLAQEMVGLAAARQDGLAVLVTRSFTHVGPGQSLAFAASSFAHQIARIEAGHASPVLSVGNLESRRDLTDVRDTVRAYHLLMSAGIPATPYNVCTGTAHRTGAVLDGLVACAAVDVTLQQAPGRMRPSDNPLLLGDPSRLKRAVGWEPEIPLEATLAGLLDYWRAVITG